MPMNNRERAHCAYQALLAYCAEKEGREELYDDRDACILDLVCDLCHLLIRAGTKRKPLDLLICAHTLFEDELAGEEPGLREALALAIRALNQPPSFDTGIPNPHRPERTLFSYALIPLLEDVLQGPPWEDDREGRDRPCSLPRPVDAR